VTVTRNEILYALNQADKFHLAIVLVGEHDAIDGPHYVRDPFELKPGWGVSSVNYDLRALSGVASNLGVLIGPISFWSEEMQA
jgi:hypothetical protein